MMGLTMLEFLWKKFWNRGSKKMPLSKFQKELENDLKKSVKLRINNNRSTMLSVKWSPDCTEVSIHRLFENAPANVMDSLACYIRQKGKKTISWNIKSFIKDNLSKLDHTSHLKKMALEVEGNTYNLRSLLDSVNEEYFDSQLDLNITWYAQRKKKNRSQITFGLYHEPLKLIKINKFLDNPKIPKYFLRYVIYHEMLHNVCPPYYDEKGRHRIHNREFKALESKFTDYHMAQAWIEQNRDNLF